MRAAVWNADKDKALLEQRDDRGLTWSAISVEGFTRRDCQRRYKFLTEDCERPAVRTAGAAEVVEVERDGLDWLAAKRRLTPERLRAAWHYRAVFRDATEGGGALKSCLDPEKVGGASGGGAAAQTALVAGMFAAGELQRLRHMVLRGQDDMLTVMDGVCGRGHTLRKLAGEDSYRTAPLEAVLRVALDLVAKDLAHAAGGHARLGSAA